MYGVARHIMQDPSYWKNAEEFEPERFICTDPVTKKLSLRKEDRFIPFGIGGLTFENFVHLLFFALLKDSLIIIFDMTFFQVGGCAWESSLPSRSCS